MNNPKDDAIKDMINEKHIDSKYYGAAFFIRGDDSRHVSFSIKADTYEEAIKKFDVYIETWKDDGWKVVSRIINYDPFYVLDD